MKGFVKGYNKFEEFISVIIFAVLVLDVFCGVFWRYVLNNSLVWSDELSRLLFVWLTWIGVSVGEAHGEHIKITMLTDRLPFRIANVCSVIANLIVIAIAGLTAYYSYIIGTGPTAGLYNTLHLNMVIGYIAIIIGCVLLIIRLIPQIIQSLIYIVKGASAINYDDIEVPSELAGVMSKEDYIAYLKSQKGGSDK